MQNSKKSLPLTFALNSSYDARQITNGMRKYAYVYIGWWPTRAACRWEVSPVWCDRQRHKYESGHCAISSHFRTDFAIYASWHGCGGPRASSLLHRTIRPHSIQVISRRMKTETSKVWMQIVKPATPSTCMPTHTFCSARTCPRYTEYALIICPAPFWTFFAHAARSILGANNFATFLCAMPWRWRSPQRHFAKAQYKAAANSVLRHNCLAQHQRIPWVSAVAARWESTPLTAVPLKGEVLGHAPCSCDFRHCQKRTVICRRAHALVMSMITAQYLICCADAIAATAW